MRVDGLRLDSIGPRTWLLVGIAGWAVLVWLLALAGMGGNIARLDPDPSLRQPLPALRPAPPERIGPLAQYGELGLRPLFAEDRRPHPFVLVAEGEGPQAPSFDVVLTSVLITPRLQMAIVQPSGGGDSIRMKLDEPNDKLQGWRLVRLEPRRAVFEGPEGRKTLELRTFDGRGGQAPSMIAAPVPPAPVHAAGDRPGPQTEAVVDAAPTIAPAPPDATTKPPTPTSQPEMTPEQQMEAIRRRIEARRAQLRAEAQQQQAQPARKPPPPSK
jgi:general secretion pathway protein N